MPLVAKGHNGQISFDGTYVTIHRNGFRAVTTVGRGEKRFHIAQISGIQLKPAGLSKGFIQFTLPGGVERRSTRGTQNQSARTDENSVMFTSGQQGKFEHMRQEIEAAIAYQHQPQQPVHMAPPAQQPNAAEQIGQLWALHQQGAMTREEFEAQKARVLGSQ